MYCEDTVSSKIFSIYCIMTDNIEDNGKIIVVVMQKDPRKVEAGRRLAAISKAAKEKGYESVWRAKETFVSR